VLKVIENNKDLQQKELARKNIRLALLLGAVSITIFVGYIVVYYFKS
jgi:hypothetical protein